MDWLTCLFPGPAILRSLHRIERKVDLLMSEQQQFNTDVAALGDFLTGLSGQLTAIQGELADRGVTDVSSLDALVAQAQSLEPALVAAAGQSPAPPAA